MGGHNQKAFGMHIVFFQNPTLDHILIFISTFKGSGGEDGDGKSSNGKSVVSFKDDEPLDEIQLAMRDLDNVSLDLTSVV